MTGKIDGKEITASEEPFTVVKEALNEYVLESGVRVRVKASVAKIGRQIDEQGNYTENQFGDPAVLVRYALEVVTKMDSDNATGSLIAAWELPAAIQERALFPPAPISNIGRLGYYVHRPRQKR